MVSVQKMTSSLDHSRFDANHPSHHHFFAMASFVVNISSFEESVSSARQLALLRIELLEDEGVGFAAFFVPLLQRALDAWFVRIGHRGECEEEKKQETGVATAHEEAQISKLEETSTFLRTLQVHVAISRLDPTLAEEVGKQGSHLLLSRLMRYDASVWQVEENQDTIIELQEYCCQVASLTGGSFPLKVSPYSRDEMKSRLPLRFDINPVVEIATHERQHDSQTTTMLINQVTQRQSAQEDVGFVMWPSAVAMSQYLVSHPSIVENKTVLELGAGCGLTGLTASTLNPSNVVLSDFNPKVLENLQRNIALNNANKTTTSVGLDFYQQSGESDDCWIDIDGNSHSTVDIIIAADIICQPSDAAAAAKTIHDALSNNGKALIICASGQHRFGVDCFEQECIKTGLHVETSNVGESYGGDAMQLTTGFCEGMTLKLFQIQHAS